MGKIVFYPHPALRKKSRLVKEWGGNEEKTLADLKKELQKSKIGIGLSAPQVGENLNIFIAVKEIFFPCRKSSCQKNHHFEFAVFVNPEIQKTFGEKTYPLMVDQEGKGEEFMEGCLSFPDLYGSVKRFLAIESSWQEPDKTGKLIAKRSRLEGLAAIVFQHERDHLGGVLFIDRLRQENQPLFKMNKDGRKIKVNLKRLMLE